MINLLNVYQILGLSSIAIVLSEFKPLQNINSLYFIKSKNILLNVLGKIIGCSKCLALWISLIYFISDLSNLQDILFMSGITIITTMYIHKKISIYL